MMADEPPAHFSLQGDRSRPRAGASRRIALALDADAGIGLHIMVAGRLRGKAPGVEPTARIHLAAFGFPRSSITEAASHQRAPLPVIQGEHGSNDRPRCQTDGRLLADRALSRLPHDDWPATNDE